MEIGGLGFFNTVASSIKDGSQSISVSNFSGLFGSMLAGTIVTTENPVIDSKVPNEAILEVLSLLKTDDVLDIEGGLELLNQSLSTEDEEELMSLIENLLTGNSNLKELVQRIHEKLGITEAEVNVDGIKSEVKDEDLAEVKIEEFIIVLEQIVSLPLKDFSQVFDGDVKDFVKAIKLMDLLATDQDVKLESAPLKELLQQLTKKLESVIENGNKNLLGNQTSRLEFLQKTFTAVAAEMNSSTIKSKLTVETPTTSNDSNTKISEVRLKVSSDIAVSENNTQKSNVPLKNDSSIGLQLLQTSRAEQLTLNLSQSGKPTNTADLIKQFENILARSHFSNSAGTQKLLIKLNPEHLGSLRIELIQRETGLVAKIMTTTQLAKETLETHLNGLKHAFGSQNIQVDRIEVSQQMTQQQQERFFNRDGQQGSHQQWQGREEQDKHNEGLEEQSFNFSLEEALINSEV